MSYMHDLKRTLKLWENVRGWESELTAGDKPIPERDHEIIEREYRKALYAVSLYRYQNHHTQRPGGLRARRHERQARDERGYCRHGQYVGGCGADYMCGACENGPHWLSSGYSKSERARLLEGAKGVRR